MALLQGNESLSTEKMGKMGEMGRLDECWAQLEREVEREGNIGQSFGNVFVNLMETLHRSSSSMKAKNKALSQFLESIPPHFFSMGFVRFDGGSSWSDVFNQIAKYLKRSLLNKELDLLLQQCRAHAKSLHLNNSSLLLSSLIGHLSTHHIDPCNLFVGAHPSPLVFGYTITNHLALTIWWKIFKDSVNRFTKQRKGRKCEKKQKG